MFQGHPPLASDLQNQQERVDGVRKFKEWLRNLDRKYERQGEEIYVCW